MSTVCVVTTLSHNCTPDLIHALQITYCCTGYLRLAPLLIVITCPVHKTLSKTLPCSPVQMVVFMLCVGECVGVYLCIESIDVFYRMASNFQGGKTSCNLNML